MLVQRRRHVEKWVTYVGDDHHDVRPLEATPQLTPHLEVVLEWREGIEREAAVDHGQPFLEVHALHGLLRGCVVALNSWTGGQAKR